MTATKPRQVCETVLYVGICYWCYSFQYAIQSKACFNSGYSFYRIEQNDFIPYYLQVILSDPTGMTLLTVDLATGVSSPHSVLDDIEIGLDSSVDVDETEGNNVSDRTGESLPSELA